MLERKKDYRPSWNLELEEPISGNYYPITSKIYLKDVDRKLRLSVLVDRAQGGSSLQDGEIELMVIIANLHFFLTMKFFCCNFKNIFFVKY